MDKEIIEKINKLSTEIINEVNKIELNNKEYLLEYKLKDLIDLQIRECISCGKMFIYHPTNTNQKYCGDNCRYHSTKSTRKKHVTQDAKFRKIDNLRKAIYERRYRAKIINRSLSYDNTLIEILEELKILQKTRHSLDLKTFNQKINELKIQYKQAYRMNK